MVYVCLRFLEPFSYPPRKQSRQPGLVFPIGSYCYSAHQSILGKQVTMNRNKLKGIEVVCCECHMSTSQRDQQNKESDSCDNVVSQDSETIRLIVLYKAATAQV